MQSKEGKWRSRELVLSRLLGAARLPCPSNFRALRSFLACIQEDFSDTSNTLRGLVG